MDTWYTADDVRRTADRVGSYYFSPNTMRAWGSRLQMGFFPTVEDRTGGLVVVSNKTFEGPRQYVVVHFWQEEDWVDQYTVETFDNRRAAMLYAAKYAKEQLLEA